MLVKIICLMFDSAYGGFNDSEVRDFMKDKEIISVQDHLFMRNEVPYLTLVVKYYPQRVETNSKMTPQGKREEPWREELAETDMGLFNLFRDWRSTRCKKEGIPPYVILTNKQLAQIVKTRPQTLPELGKIDGIGQAKLDKYGQEILGISKIDPELPLYPAASGTGS